MTKLVSEICCACGIEFGLPETFQRALRQNHNWFYCPNGHQQHYTGETEAEKFRRERDRLKQQLAQKDDEIRWQRESRERTERSLTATRGVVTRMKNRAAAGVCPCCNRTFQQLARHMKSQHPTYLTEADPADLHVIQGGRAS